MSAQHIIVKRMTKSKKSFSLSDTKDSRELLGRSWSKEESGYLHLQNEEGHQFEIGAPPCSVDDLKFLNYWK